jgi:prepilin peptidase CpaA
MADSVSCALVFLSAGLLVAALLHDLAVRTIPNWIPACVALAGLVLRIQAGNLIAGLGIAAVLLLILGLLWLRGFIGGGDMKLIPAVALVLPPAGTPAFILSVSLAGGVLALIYLALRFIVPRPQPGPRRGFLARVVKAEAWRMHRRGPLPYAAAIAGGALPIFIETFSR